MDDAGDTRITLSSRYGYNHWLEKVDGHRWKYEAAPEIPLHYRFGSYPDIEGIAYFDPPGGPLIHVGEFVARWQVAAISRSVSGIYVWLGDAKIEGDYEKAKAEFEESRETVPVTVTSAEYSTVDFGEKPETATAGSGGFCSFTPDSFGCHYKYDYPRHLTIGMIGKAGAGKDTVADYLAIDYAFSKIALADPLKSAVQTIFAIDDLYMYDREKREEELPDWPGWTVRKLLQFVGTELFRTHVDQDVWVKNVVLRAKRQQLTVISDVRFPNEVEIPRKILGEAGHDVVFIKVVREGVNGTPSGIQGHESEAHDLEGDFTIVNDGTIEDLYAKTREIMVEIQRRALSQ